MSGESKEQESEVGTSDVAAELIGELVSEGTQVDEGGFTLDPTKALEKLRAFQLAEREAWVLFLVEAAALAGASARIAFWAGEDLAVDFVGPALGAGQLESVFLAPFEDMSELEGEALALTTTEAEADWLTGTRGGSAMSERANLDSTPRSRSSDSTTRSAC